MKNSLRSLLAVLPLLVCGEVHAKDYSLAIVHSFTGTGGMGPSATLIQGTDGNFYGTTVGDFNNVSTNTANAAINGTVFKLTPGGAISNIHVFTGSNGSHPMAPLVELNGLLWGTGSGGDFGNGITVFHMKKDGSEFTTVLHGPAEVGINNATLVKGKDGNLYGTERQNGTVNYGRIFRITPGSDAVKVLYNFKGHPDGEFPNGPLVQGKDGYFYGCCGGGGVNDEGTIYRISSTGIYHQLHAMAQNGVQGSGPIGLVQAADGNFYGVARQGGNESFPSSGTVFRISPAGKFSKFLDLGSRFGVAPSAPVDPQSAMILGKDGALYGVGVQGGDTNTGYGGVFRVTTAGKYSSVFGFNGVNGAYVVGGLVLARDGHFYGTTAGKKAQTDSNSGGDQYGKVFKLTAPSADPAAEDADDDADADADDASE